MDFLRSVRGARGQATSEYVALVALVAVVLALAAGLTSGGLGGQVLAGLQRGLCRVTDGACPRPVVPGPDLAPCPLGRSVRTEELNGTIAFVRLGSNESLAAVRTSDGRVTVMLADGTATGGELGVGVHVGAGGRAFGGTARAGLSATWTSGRAWTFADEAAAGRFVADYGAKATVGGRLVDELRSRCSFLCDALGWRPHAQLPTPDETYEEGGETATLNASFGLGGFAPATLGGEQTEVLGRRTRRDGATTWYLRLTRAVTAGLELPGTRASWTRERRAIVSYALDAHGRPAKLGVLLAGEGRADVASIGKHGVRGAAGSGDGDVTELEATLDLRDRANRAAAAGLLDALRASRTLDVLTASVRALAARLALGGQLDRRTYALTRWASGTGATACVGLEVGAAFERSTRSMRLLSAETRLPGLPFLPRDDCRPA